MTISDRIGQNDGKPTLTRRQRKFIPILLTCPTVSEACKKGRLNRTTFYGWTKDLAFKAEVERQREEITQEAFGILSHNLTKAIEVLANLLEDGDKELRRFAAKDVIGYFLKHKEVDDLIRRIEAIEERLETRG